MVRGAHAALAASGYSNTKVVADDSGWDEADAMATDPKFSNSVDILAAPYSCEGGDGGNADLCSTTQKALDSGKPLWDSEQGSQDDNPGAGPLIRAITRGYIDAKMTALLNWPLIASITSNLPYPTHGMMVANQPWSGHYSVGTNTWVTAQVTQFTQPGWRFLDGGSGYLGGDRTNGSYVSLKSPDDRDSPRSSRRRRRWPLKPRRSPRAAACRPARRCRCGRRTSTQRATQRTSAISPNLLRLTSR